MPVFSAKLTQADVDAAKEHLRQSAETHRRLIAAIRGGPALFVKITTMHHAILFVNLAQALWVSADGRFIRFPGDEEVRPDEASAAEVVMRVEMLSGVAMVMYPATSE